MKTWISKLRIEQFLDGVEGKAYVSLSGRDSTVLLDLARSVDPNIPACFVDTGLEYPEVREHIKTIENVTWMRPKMNFKQVIEKYGYPILSKKISMGFDRYRNTKDPVQKDLRINGGVNPTSGKKQLRSIPVKYQYLLKTGIKFSERCCDVLKKEPLNRYHKETGRYPFIGTMADDSEQRKISYLKTGCNSFAVKKKKSMPLAHWTTENVKEYLRKYNISYAKIYDMGEEHTGCMFCMFGVQMEETPNRFQRMEVTHPKEYNTCVNKLGCGEVLDLIDVDYKHPYWDLIQ
jgi:3'-phosphoadenosine 5'-phosphosulfate sulfotransferase (PAPS reductase)/FAD synthetase